MVTCRGARRQWRPVATTPGVRVETLKIEPCVNLLAQGSPGSARGWLQFTLPTWGPSTAHLNNQIESADGPRYWGTPALVHGEGKVVAGEAVNT